MWQTIGHGWATALMARAVRSGKVAHSYLIAGPGSVGKRHLARRMAATLNCTGDEPPCGACEACARIARDAHPDVTLVEPEDGRLKIAQVRAVQHDLSLSPYQGRWRVAIMTDFQTATAEAANALLKTLEEPPSRAVLILTATDPSLLLPTVVSRCQVLPVRGVPQGEIERALRERWHLDPQRATLLARLSAGRVGWAVRAAQEEAEASGGASGLLAERARDLGRLQDILAAGRAERILAAEDLAGRDDLPALLTLWQGWWRDVLLAATGCGDRVANVDYGDIIGAQAESVGPAAAGSLARGPERTLQQIDQNVNPRLALEVLLQSWPHLAPAHA